MLGIIGIMHAHILPRKKRNDEKLMSILSVTVLTSEVGIYKRKQESKKTRKQESDQEKYFFFFFS